MSGEDTPWKLKFESGVSTHILTVLQLPAQAVHVAYFSYLRLEKPQTKTEGA